MHQGPRIVTDETGGAVVLWSVPIDGEIQTLVASRSSGGEWSETAWVEPPPGASSEPWVTSNTRGAAMLAWQAEGLAVRRYLPDCSAQDHKLGGEVQRTGVHALAPSGEAFLTWTEQLPDGSEVALGARVGLDGAVEDWSTIFASAPGESLGGVTLGAYADGSALALTVIQDAPTVRHHPADGYWSAPVVAPSSGGLVFSGPRLAVWGQRALMVWASVDAEDIHDTAIWSAHYSPTDGFSDAAPVLETGYLYDVYLRLADDGAGGAFLLWHSGYLKPVQVMTHEQSTWSRPKTLASSTGDRAHTVHRAPNGNAAFTTSVFNVNVITYTPEGGFTEPRRIRSGTYEVGLLANAAALTTGETLVVWEERKGHHVVLHGDHGTCDPSYSEIWAAAIAPDGSLRERQLSPPNGSPEGEDLVFCDLLGD